MPHTREHAFSTLVKRERGIQFGQSTDISGLFGDPWYGLKFWEGIHKKFGKEHSFGLEVVAWKQLLSDQHELNMILNRILGFHGRLVDGLQLNIDILDGVKIFAADLRMGSLETILETAIQLKLKIVYINLHSRAASRIKKTAKLDSLLQRAKEAGVSIQLFVENDATPKNLKFTLHVIKQLNDAGIPVQFLYDPVHHLRELEQLATVSPAAWQAILQTIRDEKPTIMHEPFGTVAYDSFCRAKIDQARWQDYGAEAKRQDVFHTIEFQVPPHKQIVHNPNDDSETYEAAMDAATIFHTHILK